MNTIKENYEKYEETLCKLSELALRMEQAGSNPDFSDLLVREWVKRYDKEKERCGDLNIKILQLEAELNNKKKECEILKKLKGELEDILYK